MLLSTCEALVVEGLDDYLAPILLGTAIVDISEGGTVLKGFGAYEDHAFGHGDDFQAHASEKCAFTDIFYGVGEGYGDYGGASECAACDKYRSVLNRVIGGKLPH